MRLLQGPQGGEARRALAEGALQLALQPGLVRQPVGDLALAPGEVAGEPRGLHGARADGRHVGLAPGPHRLDRALQPPLLDREAGAQEVALGRDLGGGERHQGLGPAPGEACRAGVQHRQEQEAAEARGQEAESEDHQGFDHARNRSPTGSRRTRHIRALILVKGAAPGQPAGRGPPVALAVALAVALPLAVAARPGLRTGSRSAGR